MREATASPGLGPLARRAATVVPAVPAVPSRCRRVLPEPVALEVMPARAAGAVTALRVVRVGQVPLAALPVPAEPGAVPWPVPPMATAVTVVRAASEAVAVTVAAVSSRPAPEVTGVAAERGALRVPLVRLAAEAPAVQPAPRVPPVPAGLAGTVGEAGTRPWPVPWAAPEAAAVQAGRPTVVRPETAETVVTVATVMTAPVVLPPKQARPVVSAGPAAKAGRRTRARRHPPP